MCGCGCGCVCVCVVMCVSVCVYECVEDQSAQPGAIMQGLDVLRRTQVCVGVWVCRCVWFCV